jgi:hypothetical protein
MIGNFSLAAQTENDLWEKIYRHTDALSILKLLQYILGRAIDYSINR